MMSPEQICEELNKRLPGYDFQYEQYKDVHGFVSYKPFRWGSGLRYEYSDKEIEILFKEAEHFINKKIKK